MSLLKRDEELVNILSEQYGLVCNYCGVSLRGRNISVDHVIPVAFGGTHDIENLKLCCVSCNVKKRTITLEDFRRKDWFSREMGVILVNDNSGQYPRVYTSAIEKIEDYTGKKFAYNNHRFFFEMN